MITMASAAVKMAGGCCQLCCFPGSRKIAHNTSNRRMSNAICMGSCMGKFHPPLPAVDQVTNKGIKEVVKLICRGLVRSRNDPSQIHILWLVLHLQGQVQASTRYDTTQGRCVALQVALHIEEIYMKGKQKTTFTFTINKSFLSARPLESSKKLCIPYVLYDGWIVR